MFKNLLFVAAFCVITLGCSKDDPAPQDTTTQQDTTNDDTTNPPDPDGGYTIADPAFVTGSTARFSMTNTNTSISEIGLVYATSPNPTMANETLVSAETIGDLHLVISMLEAETTYYVKAYRKTGSEIEYSNEITLETLSARGTGGTFSGDIVLLTQSEIDAFGRERYTSISGSLRIAHEGATTDPIVDLSPLNTIESVGATLAIQRTTQLTTLLGLENILTLTRNLAIVENRKLRNLQYLENLNSSQIGFLYIIENDILEDISALQHVEIVEKLLILGNPLLETIDIPALHTVSYDAEIRNNSSITDLSGLENLTTVVEELIIENNPNLLTLGGLVALQEAEAIHILRNDSLMSLEGLDSLATLSGLIIEYNDSLETLEGLNVSGAPLEVGAIAIRENHNLTSLNGLSSVQGSLQSISVFYNLSIQSLNGLEGVTQIDLLNIGELPELQNLDGLEGISSVTGAFVLNNLPSLENIDGLNSLTTIGGTYVNIQNLPLITNVDGLSNLTSVPASGWLEFENNTALSDFCGLNNLYIVSGATARLDVSGCAYNPDEQDIRDGNCSL